MSNQPIAKIRDGALAATIWENEGEKGKFYTVDFSRTFTDGKGKIKNSNSFSGTEVLRISRLAAKAYDEITTLRQSDKDDAQGGDVEG